MVQSLGEIILGILAYKFHCLNTVFMSSAANIPACVEPLPEGKCQSEGNSDLDPAEDHVVPYKTAKASS